jgi:hypothetical protein
MNPFFFAHPTEPRSRRRRRASAGLSLVALTVSILARTLAASAKLDPVAEESAIAAEGARTVIEEMRSHPFADIFKLYNDNPADDPGGAGTAPGNRFQVKNLAPVAVDGWVGEVIFPTIAGRLREDSADASLAMPRDLNADGLVDSKDHSADAMILPVKIRLEWASRTGKQGKRSFVMYTMFVGS